MTGRALDQLEKLLQPEVFRELYTVASNRCKTINASIATEGLKNYAVYGALIAEGSRWAGVADMCDVIACALADKPIDNREGKG